MLTAITKTGIILALIFAAIAVSDCGGGSENANAPDPAPGGTANAPKTNEEELGLLINLPYQAEDIAWKEDASKKRIVAVFKFSAEDADKIVREAETFGPSQPVSIPEQTWFPDELTAQAEMSGDETIKGIAYPANVFFQAPFDSGRITRTEGGDYFVLELSAK